MCREGDASRLRWACRRGVSPLIPARALSLSRARACARSHSLPFARALSHSFSLFLSLSRSRSVFLFSFFLFFSLKLIAAVRRGSAEGKDARQEAERPFSGMNLFLEELVCGTPRIRETGVHIDRAGYIVL